jgi:hypothetical protein
MSGTGFRRCKSFGFFSLDKALGGRGKGSLEMGGGGGGGGVSKQNPKKVRQR